MSALFDQSYQPWQHSFQPHVFRIPVIAWQTVKNVYRRSPAAVLILTGLTVLFSLPNAFLGLMLGGTIDPAFSVVAAMSGALFWTYLLVLPAVGSGLVANDVRHNALLMYFSKSIVRADYLIGKALGASVFMLLPVLLAPVAAAGIGIYGMQDKATVAYMIKLFLAMLVCTPIAIVPGLAAIMAISSCTKRNFFAGAGWVAINVVLATVSGILMAAGKLKWGYMLSISDNIFRVAREIMPAPPEGYVVAMPRELMEANKSPYTAWYSAAILAGIVVISCAVMLWRLSKAERRT